MPHRFLRSLRVRADSATNHHHHHHHVLTAHGSLFVHRHTVGTPLLCCPSMNRKMTASSFPHSSMSRRSSSRKPHSHHIRNTFVTHTHSYSVFDAAIAMSLLALDDESLLSTCSTSPDAEGPEFCADTRGCINYCLSHPKHELVFPGQWPPSCTCSLVCLSHPLGNFLGWAVLGRQSRWCSTAVQAC